MQRPRRKPFRLRRSIESQLQSHLLNSLQRSRPNLSNCTCRAEANHRSFPAAGSEPKPVQAASVEQKPTIARPGEAKPVEAKSVSKGRPSKLGQREQTHRQLTVALLITN
jgi:hypothetical protein